MEQTFTEWLVMPRGLKFNVFDVDDGSFYPRLEQLWISIPIALVLLFIRKCIFEGFVNAACNPLTTSDSSPAAWASILELRLESTQRRSKSRFLSKRSRNPPRACQQTQSRILSVRHTWTGGSLSDGGGSNANLSRHPSYRSFRKLSGG